MICHTNKILTPNSNRPPGDHANAHAEQDEFLDDSLFVLPQGYHKKEVAREVEASMNSAASEGLPAHLQDRLGMMINMHMDIFRTTFYKGPSVNIPSLDNSFFSEGKPAIVKVQIRGNF